MGGEREERQTASHMYVKGLSTMRNHSGTRAFCKKRIADLSFRRMESTISRSGDPGPSSLIPFVGIDNIFPYGDWRYYSPNKDAYGATSYMMLQFVENDCRE